jgi:hypothetical protein
MKNIGPYPVLAYLEKSPLKIVFKTQPKNPGIQREGVIAKRHILAIIIDQSIGKINFGPLVTHIQIQRPIFPNKIVQAKT